MAARVGDSDVLEFSKLRLGVWKGHSITPACNAGVLGCGTTLASSAALDVDNFSTREPLPNDSQTLLAILNFLIPPIPPKKHTTFTMSSLGPSDPKTAVMRQVQQEAAMQNARMLVEVRLYILRLF